MTPSVKIVPWKWDNQKQRASSYDPTWLTLGMDIADLIHFDLLYIQMINLYWKQINPVLDIREVLNYDQSPMWNRLWKSFPETTYQSSAIYCLLYDCILKVPSKTPCQNILPLSHYICIEKYIFINWKNWDSIWNCIFFLNQMVIVPFLPEGLLVSLLLIKWALFIGSVR